MSDSDLAALRTQLVAVVRARVPEPDVEDVVQATLADAVAAQKKPAEPGERRAWVFGIARHKIADYHRGRKRNHADSDEVDLPDSAPHHSERDLLRWAEGALPQGEDAKQTLEWMLEEGDGAKLEEIATRAKVPAPTVRKRVSRLREHLRAQWKKELALVFAAALLAMAVYVLTREKGPEANHDHRESPAPTLSALPPQEIARGLRIEALKKCEHADYTECLKMLDRAKALDPTGDLAPEVATARAAAETSLRPAPITPPPAPPPAPSAVPTGVPTSSLTPGPTGSPTGSPTPGPTGSLVPKPPGSGATPSRATPSLRPTPTFGSGTGSSDSL